MTRRIARRRISRRTAKRLERAVIAICAPVIIPLVFGIEIWRGLRSLTTKAGRAAWLEYDDARELWR